MITIKDIERYQNRMKEVNANGCKASDFKALGRELQQEFNLTVPQVTAILCNRTEEILEILKSNC